MRNWHLASWHEGSTVSPCQLCGAKKISTVPNTLSGSTTKLLIFEIYLTFQHSWWRLVTVVVRVVSISALKSAKKVLVKSGVEWSRWIWTRSLPRSKSLDGD